MNLTTNQKRDYEKFFIERGEAGFSPKRNEEVIKRSIKKAEKMRAEKRKKHYDALGERVEAVTDYLMHIGRGKSTPIDKYFSKNMLAYLQGQRIVQTLVPQKNGPSIIKLGYIDD